LDRLEAEQKQDRQGAAKSAAAAQQSAAQVASTAQQLDRRLAALEARPAGLPAGEIADLRQQLAKLSSTITDLGPRIDAAEKAIAGAIATAEAPPTDPDWSDKVLARLRGLVTIRRIDGAGQSEPEAAVSAAERALAGGDLAGAVAALGRLAGPSAEAARPWLQMARQRLAVEAALHRVEELLTARLGAARRCAGSSLSS